ncbi:MAG: hypothetical protein KA467_02135 [Bacteroidales bacterium]|jgi:hypothetical protein|nr:hypothetical protein [Bacteroidales bacterium]
MDEVVFSERLQELLEESEFSFEDGLEVERVRSFGNLLTSNSGVIVTLSNGMEFQLTVVRSK